MGTVASHLPQRRLATALNVSLPPSATDHRGDDAEVNKSNQLHAAACIQSDGHDIHKNKERLAFSPFVPADDHTEMNNHPPRTLTLNTEKQKQQNKRKQNNGSENNKEWRFLATNNQPASEDKSRPFEQATGYRYLGALRAVTS